MRSSSSCSILLLLALGSCAVLPVVQPGVALPSLGSAAQQAGRMPVAAQVPLSLRPRADLDRLAGNSAAWVVCDYRYRVPRAAADRLDALRTALPSLKVTSELPAELGSAALTASAARALPAPGAPVTLGVACTEPTVAVRVGDRWLGPFETLFAAGPDAQKRVALAAWSGATRQLLHVIVQGGRVDHAVVADLSSFLPAPALAAYAGFAGGAVGLELFVLSPGRQQGWLLVSAAERVPFLGGTLRLERVALPAALPAPGDETGRPTAAPPRKKPVRPTSFAVADLEIGPKPEAALSAAGITRCDQLVGASTTHLKRVGLAQRTRLPGGLLYRWARMCDLLRLPDFSLDTVELFAAAGVSGVAVLIKQKPDRLAVLLERINKLKRLVGTPPAAGDIARWQAAARKLPGTVK